LVTTRLWPDARKALRKAPSASVIVVAAAYASIVQEDLFSDFFAYRSMATDVNACEETFVAR
jgi:hypothetical protein